MADAGVLRQWGGILGQYAPNAASGILNQQVFPWLTGPVATDDYGNEIPHDASSLASMINSLVPHPAQSQADQIAGTVGALLPAGGVGAARDLLSGQTPEALLRAIGYHGSPYKFDAFDPERIGTGQGAQAYGHGLYFAEHPDVAREYAKELSQPDWRHFQLPSGEWGAKVKGHDQMSPLFQTREELKQWIGEGNLYKVDIPDEDVAKMLHWDKRLSEQPEHVKQALDFRNRFSPLQHEMLPRDVIPFSTPEDTAALVKAGIPGIQYLDQGSRVTGEGTRNFVVFDPSNVKILERNSQPLGTVGALQVKKGK